jgi:CO/xanthine dehydrogenase FAD-binding subunit
MAGLGKLRSCSAIGEGSAVDYLVPDDLADAVALRARGATVLAGGTDVYAQHVGRPLPAPLLDVHGLAELRGIEPEGDGFRIGALTRWADVAAADLPPAFDGLRAAAREVGGIQIQHAATVGGNLCNASPAADGIPPLLTLDASVELTAASGTRVLPLEDFLTGYRTTALRDDELLTAVVLPPAGDAASAFRKLGLRRYLVISVVMVAAVLGVAEDGRVRTARVAVGACSPVARRLPSLEASLVGRPAAEVSALAGGEVRNYLAALEPIDDVRATAAYRLDAAAVLVGRALAACTGAVA